MTRPFRLPWHRRGDAAAPSDPIASGCAGSRKDAARALRSGSKTGAHDSPDLDDATMQSVLSALATGETVAAPASSGADAAPPGAGTARPEAAVEAVLPAAERPTFLERLREGWVPWRPLRPFLVATLAPVPLLVLAAVFGGIWSLLALLSMTAFVFVADELARRRGIAGPAPFAAEMADRLSAGLAGLHFLLLPFAVWALSGGAGLGFLGWIATFLAFGLWFGQVSNANAHELIHRTDRRLFGLGMWVYVSLLFGHHTSAHRLVHHRFVATTDDPNTAAAGESFYAFAGRAWPGAFVAGYEMETNRRKGRAASGIGAVHPYTIYIAGGILWFVAMLTAFGFDGALAYLLLCGHAQVQLLLSDYVQHYGLLRRTLPDGGVEPAGPQHSWDAPHAVSGVMMLNASRHADHHAHPSRHYPELRLSPGKAAPLLPYSLPVMGAIALAPSLWHRIMDRRLARLERIAQG